MKYRIRLDTINDVSHFVAKAMELRDPVYLTDGNGLKVNGKSFLGALHAMEFTNLFLESDYDGYSTFKDFIVTD